MQQCLTCQKVKVEQCKCPSLLQPLCTTEWKWESISMDFIIGLPRTQKGHDSIFVVGDRLDKMTHFLPIKIESSTSDIAHRFVKEIVRLYGIPNNIVSD